LLYETDGRWFPDIEKPKNSEGQGEGEEIEAKRARQGEPLTQNFIDYNALRVFPSRFGGHGAGGPDCGVKQREGEDQEV
jgi:hypothetical protein